MHCLYEPPESRHTPCPPPSHWPLFALLFLPSLSLLLARSLCLSYPRQIAYDVSLMKRSTKPASPSSDSGRRDSSGRGVARESRSLARSFAGSDARTHVVGASRGGARCVLQRWRELRPSLYPRNRRRMFSFLVLARGETFTAGRFEGYRVIGLSLRSNPPTILYDRRSFTRGKRQHGNATTSSSSILTVPRLLEANANAGNPDRKPSALTRRIITSTREIGRVVDGALSRSSVSQSAPRLV